jgi:site-specific DNA recombinase
MNALFLKDLGQKTWRGLEGRVRKGRSGGGLCFGYDLKKELDHNNEPIRGGRVINAIETEVIRRIFSDYGSGRSPGAIAKSLNAEHVAGPGSRLWSDTAIRGHHLRRTGILHNELYIGRLIWNKQHYLKDPTSGRRLARPNPENKWIVMECPELRVLEQPLWNAAQARLAAIRETPGVKSAIEKKFWLKRRSNNLLTGLAKCGVCGGDLAPSGQDYLACGAARRQGACSNRRSIRRPVLEGLILDALQTRLMDPVLRRRVPFRGQPSATQLGSRHRAEAPRAG